MKAAIRRKYGRPNTISIEAVEQPVPTEDEVLIKVHAATVNRTDCANLTAKPFIMRFFLGLFKPRKIVLGTDFAGEIMQVGKKVKSFSVGDRVFGFNDAGSESHAHYLTTSVKNLFQIPEKSSFSEAAASLEGAHYAYSFIRKTNIEPGQRVLINGATGGIGSALLQFVRQYDVSITATCNTKNIKLMKSLGADNTHDYTKGDFTEEGGQYDFIFDAVGKSTYGKCKPLLSERGIYISSELGPYAQNVFYSLFAPFYSKKVLFPIPYDKQESIPFIINQLEGGTFKPVIDRAYPLSDVSEAFGYVIAGKKTGNVLIKLAGE